jgi:hypothetical protein
MNTCFPYASCLSSFKQNLCWQIFGSALTLLSLLRTILAAVYLNTHPSLNLAFLVAQVVTSITMVTQHASFASNDKVVHFNRLRRRA